MCFPRVDITLNYIALYVWLKNLPASIDITVPSIVTCNAEGDPGVIWEQHMHINWFIDLTVINQVCISFQIRYCSWCAVLSGDDAGVKLSDRFIQCLSSAPGIGPFRKDSKYCYQLLDTWSIWQYLLIFWQIWGIVWQVINSGAQEKQDSILWKLMFNMDQSHDTLCSQSWPIWFKINKVAKKTTWMIHPADLVVK